MNTKVLYILLSGMIIAVGVIGYLIYGAYNDYKNKNDDVDYTSEDLPMSERQAKYVEGGSQSESEKQIEDIKDDIIRGDAFDSLEKLVDAVESAQNIDYSTDYELEVAITFAKMRISTMESLKVEEDPSYKRITTDKDANRSNLAKLVHPNYNGILADRIKKILEFQYTRESWVVEYNKYNGIEMQEVKVGMTRQDVIDLTEWGRPIKINKTENIYGVSEQWVYPNYQYLYFDDGILTSISTSN